MFFYLLKDHIYCVMLLLWRTYIDEQQRLYHSSIIILYSAHTGEGKSLIFQVWNPVLKSWYLRSVQRTGSRSLPWNVIMTMCIYLSVHCHSYQSRILCSSSRVGHLPLSEKNSQCWRLIPVYGPDPILYPLPELYLPVRSSTMSRHRKRGNHAYHHISFENRTGYRYGTGKTYSDPLAYA